MEKLGFSVDTAHIFQWLPVLWVTYSLALEGGNLLRCSIVLTLPLNSEQESRMVLASASKTFGSKHLQMHQLKVAATCLGEMWGFIQSNSANPNVLHPKSPWCMGSCETQQPACLTLSLYPAYSQLCHFACKLEGKHFYPATFLIFSSLILAACSFSRPNFCLLKAKKILLKCPWVWHWESDINWFQKSR